MQTVIGIFDNVYDAQKAVQQLKTSGFSDSDVDVTVRDGGNTSSADFSADSTIDDTTTGSSDYSSGSANDIAGSSASTHTARSYDSGDHDDSFGDKVSKFFKNLFGGDDDEADRYSHVANKSGTIVTVHAQSEEQSQRAADILDEYGAVDVNERASQYGYSGYSNSSSAGLASDSSAGLASDSSAGLASGSTTGLTSGSSTGLTSGSSTGLTSDSSGLTSADSENSQSLNVIREDVQVGKREVETGGVRLRSRIVERPVEEKLRLKQERVTVERTPVDRAATTADFQNFKEGEIEMTERAEVAEVSKQARVVEEIKLSKEVNERTETVRETARDTEVDIENLDKDDLTTGRSKNIDL